MSQETLKEFKQINQALGWRLVKLQSHRSQTKHGAPQIKAYLDPGWSWVKFSRKISSPWTSPDPTRHQYGRTRINTEPTRIWARYHHGMTRTIPDQPWTVPDPTRTAPEQTRNAGWPRITTLATRTVPDYPGLKNPPGRSLITTAIFNSLKLPGRCPGQWRAIQDHPGLSRTIQATRIPDWPNFLRTSYGVTNMKRHTDIP